MAMVDPPPPKAGYGKLIASGAVFVASLAIYALGLLTGHTPPADVQGAITGLAMLIAHYYTPNGDR